MLNVALFLVDGSLGPGALKALSASLQRLGTQIMLKAGPAPGLGLACIRRPLSSTEPDVKLQVLCPAAGEVALREWHLACLKLQMAAGGNAEEGCSTDSAKLAVALRALVNHTAKQGQRGRVYLISHAFNKAPSFTRVLQDAERQGIQVVFVALQLHTPDTSNQDIAHASAALRAFEEDICSKVDTASVCGVDADPLSLEACFQEWLAQMLQNPATSIPQQQRPITELSVVMPQGGEQQQPVVLRCSLASQIMRWQPWFVCPSVDASVAAPTAHAPGPSEAPAPSVPRLQLGSGQRVALQPEAAAALAAQAAEVAGHVVLYVDKAIQAEHLNMSLTHGWPHILLPSASGSVADEAAPPSFFSAVCEVMCQNDQLLVAWSMADIGDDGIAQACMFKQWYVLWPSPRPTPSLLLRKLASREQLLPVHSNIGAAAEPSKAQMDSAQQLINALTFRHADSTAWREAEEAAGVGESTAPAATAAGDNPLSLPSGCAAAMAELARLAVKEPVAAKPV